MKAPELQVSQWFNTKEDLKLADFAGKVLVIEAFQMLCPGCVSHGIPLAQAVHATFPQDQVAVIGLHTVFEHHEAMTLVSLAAFLHEYRIQFPVGVDAPGVGNLPKTMEAYKLRGTPSLIIIDKVGTVRAQHFGDVSQLRLGAEIATLLCEGVPQSGISSTSNQDDQVGCDDNGCSV